MFGETSRNNRVRGAEFKLSISYSLESHIRNLLQRRVMNTPPTVSKVSSDDSTTLSNRGFTTGSETGKTDLTQRTTMTVNGDRRTMFSATFPSKTRDMPSRP